MYGLMDCPSVVKTDSFLPTCGFRGNDCLSHAGAHVFSGFFLGIMRCL